MPPAQPEQAIAAPIGIATALRKGRERTPADASLDKFSLFGVLSVYWCYVALSNVLYAHSMQATMDEHMAFAPPLPRLLQHLFLYPFLIGCVWSSLRVGWQPAWRTAPVQILLGLGFSILSRPALILGQIMDRVGAHLWGAGHSTDPHSLTLYVYFTGAELSTWLASALSFLLTYGFGLALITGLSWYHRYRETQARFDALERSLSATRLAALRMQLSPHTLFNLLHTIRGQIAWDPASAQAMVVQLGDVLRRLLAAGERDFSRLSDEFEFVRLYLELQRSRFSDRLSVDMAQLGELSNLWIPSLILQPLVENAVAHGLAGHVGPVVIRVEAGMLDQMLTLRVVNTIAAGAVSGAHGIGLRNVRERLSLHFSDAATFRASSEESGTWIAQIHMPLVGDAGGGRRAAS
jgi:hypothetical protein